MNKIPVFRTIGRAYGFTFGNLATIIGLVWLPLIIQTVGGYVISERYMSTIQAFLAKGDFSALGGVAGYAYLFFFGSLFLTAVMSAPVLRQALGLRQGGAYVYLWPGANEFRLFGANFALLLMLIAIMVVVWIAALILIVAFAFAVNVAGTAMVAGISAQVILKWSVVALLLAVLAALIFVLFRLSFLIGPVTIAERKIDLVRAWSLTHGNFWRIFLVSLAVTVPLLAISWAVEWAFFGTFGSNSDLCRAVPARAGFRRALDGCAISGPADAHADHDRDHALSGAFAAGPGTRRRVFRISRIGPARGAQPSCDRTREAGAE